MFEAGHYKEDYEREFTRELIYISYLSSLNYIANSEIIGNNHKEYFEIPENGKCFYDFIIRNAKVEESKDELKDIGIQYQEKLIDNKIEFIPKVLAIDNLKSFYGHMEYDAKGFEVFEASGQLLQVGYENVFVILNNEKISLLIK